MKSKNIVLSAFLIIGIISAVAFGQDGSAPTDASGSVAPDTSEPGTGFATISGIWTISLAGTDVTLAINQSGDMLSGSCKFEGDTPWNGVLAGSVSGTAVNIALAALQGEVLVSTEITGTVQEDSLKGSFVESSGNGNLSSGVATGTLISPDISDYTPAKVQAQTTSGQQSTQTQQVQQSTQTQQVQQQPQQLGEQTKAQYKDVTQLALGLDPNIMPRNFPL